jgi:hypothetical protein
MPAATGNVHAINRIIYGALVVVVIPFFVGTTFYPQHTAVNFAWPLAPRMSAYWFGALYLTVIYAFARIAVARWWHEVALIVWATVPVLAALGVTTIVHWDRFTKGTMPFYVWIVVYVCAPPVLAWLGWRNARDRAPAPEVRGPVVPRGVRFLSLAFSCVFLVVAVALWVAPESMATVWPWPIKPLTSRAIGCLLAAPVVVHVVAIVETRWSAFRIVTQSAILWFATILVSAWRAWPEIDRNRPLTWAFIGFIALELVFAAAIYWRMERKPQHALSA